MEVLDIDKQTSFSEGYIEQVKEKFKSTTSFIIGGDSSSEDSDSESTVQKVSVEVQTERYYVTEQSTDDTAEPRPLEECIAAMKSDVS